MPDSSGGIVVSTIRHGLTRECNGFRKDKSAEKLAESEEDSDIANRSTDESKAYRRGKAASKVKLHSQEMMLAQVGSPLAIENAHRNLLDMEDDEWQKFC